MDTNARGKYAKTRGVDHVYDGPILALSDTHFGFEPESETRFLGFIEYLKDWVDNGTTTIYKTIDGKPETLDAPRRIILLGDIIDLWVRRDANIVRPYKESYNPVTSLIELGGNTLDELHKIRIAYVVGNHDRLADAYKDKNVLCNWMHVYDEAYPETVGGQWQGEQIGNKKYLFLHGHQFSMFRNKSVLRFGNFIGSAAAAAEGFWQFKWFGGIALIVTVVIAASAFVPNPLFSALSGFATSFGVRFGAGVTLLTGLFLGILATFGVLWLFGRLMWVYYELFRHPGGATKSKHDAVQTLLAWVKRHLRRRPVCDTVQSRGFKQAEPAIDADIVVFGHTHNPGVCTIGDHQHNHRIQQLVNTGSWIAPLTDDDNYDTFVYIDESRGRLYRWNRDQVLEERGRWSNR
jgi:predicted phosphodiesterase